MLEFVKLDDYGQLYIDFDVLLSLTNTDYVSLVETFKTVYKYDSVEVLVKSAFDGGWSVITSLRSLDGILIVIGNFSFDEYNRIHMSSVYSSVSIYS